MVDAVTDGLAHALVGEFLVRAVEGEHEFVAAVGRGDMVGVGVKGFRQGRVHWREHVHVAAFQCVDGGIVIGDEVDDHMLRGRLVRGAPIFRVGLKHHLAGGIEGFHGVWAGAHGLGLRVIGGVLVEHQARAPSQVPQQVGVRGAESDSHGVRVKRFGLAQAFHLVGVIVLLLLQLVDGPCHVVGIKHIPIGEGHVPVEMEGVGCAVCGDVPAFCQTGLYGIVGVSADKSLVHVADEHLFDGRSGLAANVEAGRGEFESDGYGVGLVCRLLRIPAVEYGDRAYDDGDGDDCRDNDAPLVRSWGFRCSDAGVETLVRAGRAVRACCVACCRRGCIGIAVCTM